MLLPEDPEDWTDEQWIAWLEEADAAERERQTDDDAERPTLPSWRKGPIATQFLAVSMLAMHDVFYGQREEPAIVVDAAGDPPGDDPLDVHLDPDHPEESVVIVRPWLLEHRDEQA